MTLFATNYYEWLGKAERHAELKEVIETKGYDGFRTLVGQLEEGLKLVAEDGFEDFACRLAAGTELFPFPARFSPTWQRLWEEIRAKLRWKRYVFEAIPAHEREGEWQIVINNPFTNDEIVCYPGLSFLEAAYMFGYFRSTLEKNEYLRLQKVVNAIVMTGE